MEEGLNPGAGACLYKGGVGESRHCGCNSREGKKEEIQCRWRGNVKSNKNWMRVGGVRMRYRGGKNHSN